MTGHSQAQVVIGTATLNSMYKASNPDDESSADMSLISDEITTKTQTQIVQDLNCTTQQLAVQASDAVN